MKQRMSLILAFLVLTTGLAWSGFADQTESDEATTLTGKFLWTQRDYGGDLEAIFTSTGEDSWAVTFNFDFREEPRTYTGTAKGSLTNGELHGQVFNEDKRRTFIFKGTSKDGEFTGTHEETTQGRERETGTMALSH